MTQTRNTLRRHLLWWHAKRRAWFHLVFIFLFPRVSRRTHPWPLLLIPLQPVPLPLLFSPDPLLLTLTLPLSLPFSLSALPLTVISLSLSVTVALPRVSISFTLLLRSKWLGLLQKSFIDQFTVMETDVLVIVRRSQEMYFKSWHSLAPSLLDFFCLSSGMGALLISDVRLNHTIVTLRRHVCILSWHQETWRYFP